MARSRRSAPEYESQITPDLHEKPGEIDYARLYDERYFREYLPVYGRTAFRLRQRMYRQEYSRISRYIRSGRVLDFGCGCGDFLQLFPPRAGSASG